jgi:hypothetical protein
MTFPRSLFRIRAAWTACSVAALLLGPSVGADDEAVSRREGDAVSVFSGDLRVPAGVRQEGDVVCIGGTATIDGEVQGNVVVVLGRLQLRGTVDGSVSAVLTDVELENARVDGELTTVLGELDVRGSTVQGEVVNILGPLTGDEISEWKGRLVDISFGRYVKSFRNLLFWLALAHKLVVFVLLVALVTAVPERIRTMSEAVPVRYLSACFVGLLGYLGWFALLGLLSITVVGLLPGLLAFFLVKWAGIAAIFHAVGQRLGRALGWSLSPLGAVALVFAVYATLLLAPAALGWPGLLLGAALRLLFLLLVEVPALGLVILTRLGGATSPAKG